MKIQVRAIKGGTHEVEVNPQDTIQEVKAKIMATGQFPVESLKLIYKGRVLGEDTTVQSCGIEEGEFLVVMANKPKTSDSDSAKPTAAAASSAPAPASAAASAAAAAPAPTPAPAPAAAGAPLAPDQATVQMLCDMGFARSDVEACLRAAFNNPDRAVEYLMSGIPPSVTAAQQAPAPAPPPPPAAPMPAPAPAVPAASPALGVGATNFASAAGGGAGVAGGAAATGPLAQLRQHPRFADIQMVVQQNPQMLNQVIVALANHNPELMQLIAENQEEFVQMLQEPIAPRGPGAARGVDPVQAMLAAAQAAAAAGAGASGAAGAPATAGGQAQGAAPGQGQAQVQLSPEDRAAVERLMALGFDRASCVQAYIGCDRQEEVAANFLFESMEDGDD